MRDWGLGTNAENWGFKFKVTPVELRMNDEKALQGLNFELGSWLFEFTLTQVPSAVKRHFILDLYDAIVWYVVNSKPSAKSRGVELLVRLLLHIRQVEKYAVHLAGIVLMHDLCDLLGRRQGWAMSRGAVRIWRSSSRWRSISTP